MLRVVVDPNVFVSAIITPNGVSGAAIRAGLAIEANVDLIATGDHDLLDASVTPDVLGPRELLERIEER